MAVAPTTSPAPSETPIPSPIRPVTVVTGGSDGIGLAIAHRFAALGHDLLLVARGTERLQAAAAALRSRHGRRVDVLALDLTEASAPGAIEAALARDGGYARIIVNSAGIGLSGAFSTRPIEAIEALIALNITALTRIMRHFAPQMQARGSGGFLNLASLGGYVPGPYQATYYASKAYVIALSEAVAAETRSKNLRVTVVSPGPVVTDFHARMQAEQSLYRRLLPAPGPDYVAWWAVTGFRLGLRVVVPGFLSLAAFAALRLLPHRLSIPIVGVLLRPRGREADNA
ncbi:MAG: SDR family NAD(P)-dependent oxidoreductase [Hyphomicrobiaceae bacterium]